MKNVLVYLLAAAMVLGLYGCGAGALKPETGTVGGNTPELPAVTAGGGNMELPTVEFAPADPVELAFEVQYIRTDGSGTGVFPRLELIADREALDSYYLENRNFFYLERREQVYSDTSIGFLDACDRYDESFFETHYLIFVLLQEGSGSVRHQVEGVSADSDGQIGISVTSVIPEEGTCDEAQWHLILELERSDSLPEKENIRLFLDGCLRWKNGYPVTPPKEPRSTEPPEGTLYTPEGAYPLQKAGYSWFYTQGEQMLATIADQCDRPLGRIYLELVNVSGEYAETVYIPMQSGEGYEPTGEVGYLIKLEWPDYPDEITVTCWQEAVLDGKNVREESIAALDAGAFYAKSGDYVYEIRATWEDRGESCYGTANYYVCIRTPDHGHQTAEEPQTVKEPFVGYCGNTWTRLHVGENTYEFMFGNSVALTDILLNLDYKPGKFCRCMAEYTVDTEFGLGYELNLTKGFARCEVGQASLTREQVEQIKEIVHWAVTTNCEYPLE